MNYSFPRQVSGVTLVAVLFALISSSCTSAAALLPPQDLTITVKPDHPREFIFTDKGAAHLAGEAVGVDTRSYHGFYIAMHEVVDGWQLQLEDGTVVGPETVFQADITPEEMKRYHRLPDGTVITEIVQLFDGENGFRVVYDGVPGGMFSVIPRMDMRFLWKVGKPAYETRWDNGTLLICRQDAVNQEPDSAHPAWLAVTVRGAAGFTPDGRHLDTVYPKGRVRKAMDRTSPYLPGKINGRIPLRVPSGRVEVVFAADVSPEAATRSAARLRAESFDLLATRRQRIQNLIQETRILTGNEDDDRALAWARVSLDNLIMNQRGPGIYAGFYWFTTYWGRDTFISLPGACIVSGDFATARTLLRGFAQFQNTDPENPRLGRVPNFVTVDQVQYASIDGTWWFVRALDELWLQSGDDEFAREMAPVVFRAIEGAQKYAVDDQGFLLHGDGETWMDGGGEEHPYSPRGNRANEVQALWHRGLLTGAKLAQQFPELNRDPREYSRLADKLASNFQQEFWVDGNLVDHLNVDGSADEQIRPNSMLAVMASPSLFSADQRDRIISQATRELVRPWGVLSLPESDPDFHPRHLNLTEYYYDEAYHNGDLWLWLSGAYVSTLNNPADGFAQTRMLMAEILATGAVGTIQEIRDGAEAKSNDEFGGATSQAWSLAELLRNVVQDYAGLRVDLTGSEPTVILKPSLPSRWPSLSVFTRIGETKCRVDVGSQVALYWGSAEKPKAGFFLIGKDGRQEEGRWENLKEDPDWPWVVRWN